MLSQQRVQSLQNKKALLDQRIEQAERAPAVDTTILRHMKKQKLEVKEILSGIRHDHNDNAYV